MVFDRPSGRAVRFCVPCQRVVSHDSTVASPVASSPPSSGDPPDWFSHGPLSCFDSLYGWGSSPPQSSRIWDAVLALLSIDLFGLAHAESNRGIPPYSTGSREHVPPEQSLFWSTHVPHIIQAYATLPHLDSQQPAAIQGGHLNSVAQEFVTPPDILSMMSVWLSEAVAGFSSRPQAARVPSSAVAPLSCCPPVHVPPHSCLSDPNRVSQARSLLCPIPLQCLLPLPLLHLCSVLLSRPPTTPLLSLALLPHIQQSLFLPAHQYSLPPLRLLGNSLRHLTRSLAHLG